MLQHFGETEAANNIEKAIETVLSSGIQNKTFDLQGKATTAECTRAIIDAIRVD